MTREEALAFYHPIRESVRRILGAAISACNQSDLIRAAKQLGLWGDGKISLPEGEQAAEMLSDIALFEPNQRGRRAFDVFLAAQARQLDVADFELAQRMGKAFFSLFRCTARHGMAGVWLEDRLDRNRSLWIMDEGMEASAPTRELLACAYSMPTNSVSGLGSSRRRMRRQPNSASRARRKVAACHSGIRSQLPCTEINLVAVGQCLPNWKMPLRPRLRG
jgi:hypothetical protein